MQGIEKSFVIFYFGIRLVLYFFIYGHRWMAYIQTSFCYKKLLYKQVRNQDGWKRISALTTFGRFL